MTTNTTAGPPRPYTADQDLRVLTLWQPWASLMAWGEKEVETRGRKITKGRHWVAIHASARKCQQADCANDSHLMEALRRHGYANPHTITPWELPLGKILAVVWFCPALQAELMARIISDKEKSFGGYAPGRWTWRASGLQVLRQPIPWKGGQGLRIAPPALRELIGRELAR